MPVNKEQLDEIEASRSEISETARVTAPELEAVLYRPIEVLDHGFFIRVIDYMGDDSSIVQSARVSYGKGTKKISNDKGLIKYLMRHRHSTPFEMCEIKFHIKLPISLLDNGYDTERQTLMSTRLATQFLIKNSIFLQQKT